MKLSSDKLELIKTIGIGLLWLTGLIFVFFIGRAVYRKFFAPDTNDTALENVNDELKGRDNQNAPKVVKPSYNDSWYDSLSEQIADKVKWDHLKAAPFSEMYPILNKIRSYTDYLKLKKAWGIQKIDILHLDAATLDRAIEVGTDFQTKAFWSQYIPNLMKIEKDYLAKLNSKK